MDEGDDNKQGRRQQVQRDRDDEVQKGGCINSNGFDSGDWVISVSQSKGTKSYVVSTACRESQGDQPPLIVVRDYGDFSRFKDQLYGRYGSQPGVSILCDKFPSPGLFSRGGSDKSSSLRKFLERVVDRDFLCESYLVRHFLGIPVGVYYRTLTLCPVCTLISRREAHLIPATVQNIDNCVYLVGTCKHHLPKKGGVATHAVRCLLSSRADLFEKWTQAVAVVSSKLASCEEPKALLKTLSTYEPFLWKIPLSSGNTLASEDEVVASVQAVLQNAPSGKSVTRKRVMLRFTELSTSDFDGINSLMLKALPVTRGHRIALELASSVMCGVAALPNSCFLSPRVYPIVVHYPTNNVVDEARIALLMALGELAAYSGLQACVDVNISLPFPDISETFSSLRSKQMVRVVLVTQYRSRGHQTRVARSVATRLETALAQNGSQVVVDVENSMDMAHLVNHICSCSEGELDESDFFSVSSLATLEILLLIIGYGRYPISVSPMAGVVAVLLNVGGEMVSLNRVVDMDRLWEAAIPHISNVRRKDFSMMASRSAFTEGVKAFKACLRPGMAEKYPNLTIDFSKRTQRNLQSLMGKAQIICARTLTDSACFDASHIADTFEDTNIRAEVRHMIMKTQALSSSLANLHLRKEASTNSSNSNNSSNSSNSTNKS